MDYSKKKKNFYRPLSEIKLPTFLTESDRTKQRKSQLQKSVFVAFTDHSICAVTLFGVVFQNKLRWSSPISEANTIKYVFGPDMDSTFNNVKAVITAAKFKQYLSALFGGVDKWQTRVKYK